MISDLAKKSDLKKKIGTLAAKAELKADLKAELKAEQEKVVKLQAFDSSYFRDKSHFEDDGTQNYLVFQPIYRFFKKIATTNHN